MHADHSPHAAAAELAHNLEIAQSLADEVSHCRRRCWRTTITPCNGNRDDPHSQLRKNTNSRRRWRRAPRSCLGSTATAIKIGIVFGSFRLLFSFLFFFSWPGVLASFLG
jgi:hypothetical protein